MTSQLFAIAHYADLAVLWTLAALSVVSFAIILERFFFLRKITRESQAVLSKVERALQDNKLEEVKEIARDTDGVLGKAAGHAIKHIEQAGVEGLEEVFNSYSITVRPHMEKFLSFLGTIGSNAPYIGLLGTVLGIMKAFHDMTTAGNEAGQKVVMAGISVALVATAAGLAVAIPSVVFYNYYNKKVQTVLDALAGLRELSLAYAKKLGIKG
jgi:biopolymer transport protein ExbB